ncbi:DUF6541 family protein [Corynebacterium sp. 335C]
MTAAAAIAATVLLLLVPGALVALAAGMRPLPALAAAAPVSVGVAGWTGWLCGTLDVPWGPLPAVAGLAAAVAVALVVRLAGAGLGAARARRGGTGTGPGRPARRVDPAAIPAAVVAAAVSVAAGARVLAQLRQLPGGAGNLWETWDAQWHANVLRFARDEGVVSSTRMGEMMNRETLAESFYPAGWHALASLVPADPLTVVNVFGLLAPMVALPAGCAWLAWRVAGRRWAPAAAPAAAVASVLAPEITVTLLGTGSLPYLLSVAMLPAALAATMRGPWTVAAMALVGVATAHPSTGVAAALCAALWLLLRPSWRRLGRLAVIGAAAGALMAPMLLSAMGKGETVAGYHGQADVDRLTSVVWTLAGRTDVAGEASVGPVPLILSLLAAAGAVILLVRRPRAAWPVAAFAVLAVVCDNAQLRWPEPWGGWVRGAGTIWYDMPYRLQAPMGVLRVTLAAVAAGAAVTAVARLARRAGSRDDAPGGPSPARARVRAAVAAACAAAVAMVPALWATHADAAHAVLRARGDRLVPPEDREAWRWLASLPGGDRAVVLNNPAEGSGWMYAAEGLESVFRHYPWPEGPAPLSRKAIQDVDLAGVDPEVDAALAALGVSYVFVSPPSASSAAGAALASRSWAWWAPGLTPIYEDQPATIFAVNARFTPEQLEELKAASPHPPSAPSPAWTPPRQPIIAPPGEADPLAGAVVRLTVAGACEPGDADAGEVSEAGRAAAEASRVVRAELERRGAVVLDGADPAAAAGAGAGNAGAAAAAPDQSAGGVDADLTLCVRPGEGPGPRGGGSDRDAGFRVTAPLPGDPDDAAAMQALTGADRGSLLLAAGLRDALVFRNLEPEVGPARSGLLPARAPGPSASPAAVVDLGWAAGAFDEDGGADAIGAAIADGVASMLRQR